MTIDQTPWSVHHARMKCGELNKIAARVASTALAMSGLLTVANSVAANAVDSYVPSNWVASITSDANHVYVVSTSPWMQSSLAAYDRSDLSAPPARADACMGSKVLPDGNGGVWVSSSYCHSVSHYEWQQGNLVLSRVLVAPSDAWVYGGPSNVVTAVAALSGMGSNGPMVIAGGNLWVAGSNSLAAFDPATGTFLRQLVSADYGGDFTFADMKVAGGFLYAVSNTYGRYRLVKLDVATGALAGQVASCWWCDQDLSDPSALAVWNGQVIVGNSANSSVTTFDAETLVPLRHFHVPGVFGATAMEVTADETSPSPSTLWITMNSGSADSPDQGLAKLRLPSFSIESLDKSTSAKDGYWHPSSLAVVGDDLWVGGRNGITVKSGAVAGASTTAPVDPPVQIASGWHHTCVLKLQGSVVCWGDNSAGQTDVPNNLPAATALAVGGNHSCALIAGGSVRCWGEDSFGESSQPSAYTGHAIKVSAGFESTCVIDDISALQCWGAAASQPRVDGTTDLSGSGVGVRGVAVAGINTCAIGYFDTRWHNYLNQVVSNASLYCWGNSNGLGQLNHPGRPEAGDPDPYLWANAREVSFSEQFGCVTRVTDGLVRCWGNNGNGQATPPADLATSAQIATGGWHACSVGFDKSLTCWGWISQMAGVPGHAQPPSLSGHTLAVSAGANFSCAIDDEYLVSCWGAPGSQVAVPSTLSRVTKADAPSAPTAVAGDASAVVTWSPPSFDGGSAVDYYDVTTSDGASNCRAYAPKTECVVGGLSNRVRYTFTVTAHNAAGDSEASAASNAVWPHSTDFEVFAEHQTLPLGGSTTIRIYNGPANKSVALRIGGKKVWVETDGNGDGTYDYYVSGDAGSMNLAGKVVKVRSSVKINGSLVSAEEKIYVPKLVMRATFREGRAIQATARGVAPGSEIELFVTNNDTGDSMTACQDTVDNGGTYVCSGQAPKAGNYTIVLRVGGQDMATNSFTVVGKPGAA